MDNTRWATVMVGIRHHICVQLNENETAEDVKSRVGNSLWGHPVEVKGIYPTPWNK